MRFILVSDKTYGRVLDIFGITDQVDAFYLFGARLVQDDYYFVEYHTMTKRLKEQYFKPRAESHQEAMMRAMYDQLRISGSDMSFDAFQTMMGLSSMSKYPTTKEH